jgi:hypothetical protein
VSSPIFTAIPPKTAKNLFAANSRWALGDSRRRGQTLYHTIFSAGAWIGTFLTIFYSWPLVVVVLVAGNVPMAWREGKANVAGILAQLSAQRGKPVSWYQVAQVVDGALRARLLGAIRPE